MSESELCYTKLEQFYISFGSIKDFKSKTVINTLANNAFKYQSTLNKKTVLAKTIPTLYIFNLLTNS